MLSFPGPTQAAGDSLVSNLRQPTNSTTGTGDYDHAQAFNTGGNSLGYPLKAVTLDADSDGGSGTLTVTIRETNSSGRPGNVLYTLINPSNLGTGRQAFTAPSDAHLDPNTEYWVHISFSGQDVPEWKVTYYVSEDPGAYPGWSIENHRYYRDSDSSGSWSRHLRPLRMRVLTEDASKYVQNTGKANSSEKAGLDNKKQAQKFRTGGSELGYHLGRIELDVERAPGGGNMTVTLRSRDDSGNPRNSVIYTLTKPTSVGTGLEEFYAPEGARLNPNWDYFVHVSYDDSGTTPRLRTTSSNSEDSGAYSGWNIANDRREHKNGSWSSKGNSLKIRVMAPNVPVPAPAAPADLSADTDDGQVTLTWTDPGDPSIFKYQYSTNGGASYSDISGSSAATSSHTVAGLTNGTDYTFAVRGVNATDYGTASTVVAAPELWYVKNMDQPRGNLYFSFSELRTRQLAQKFRTGGGSVGFYLGSIQFEMFDTDSVNIDDVTVTIQTVGSPGPSGTVLHTLTNPDTLGEGPREFTAPTGAFLGDNSSYFVVLEYTGDELLVKTTTSDDEDTGSYSGWSIADKSYNQWRTWQGDPIWDPLEHWAFKIKVKGPDVIPPPPAAPTNLTATPGDRRVTVTWDHPGNISIRKYQYSTDGGTTFKHMNRSNKDTTSFTFKNLEVGISHNLAIRASNLTDEGPAAIVTAAAVWPAPEGVLAEPDNGRLVLGWPNPGDSTITRYQLSTDGGQTFTDIPGSNENTTRHAVTGLTNGTEYTFALRAASDSHHSDAATVTGTPAVVLPAAPTGLSSAQGDSQVTLSWDDPGNITLEKYQLMRLASESKLAALDGADNDEFGNAVSIDGNTAVVGAPIGSAAYIFTKDSGADTWTQQAKLTGSNISAGGRFGHSVDIDGDTVLVGANYDDIGDNLSAGSVSVFVKPASGWTNATETQKLTASDGAAGDRFGSSIAIDGDTAVIGAPKDNISGSNDVGSAYVFTRNSSGVWNQAAKLTGSDTIASDELGRSVAVDGDTIVVGANHYLNEFFIGSGAAFVFTKPAAGWANSNETAKLTPLDGANGEWFGYSVAVDGDTVVVGAYRINSGSAYVFIKPTGSWADANETGKLTASDGASGDNLGFSVAVDGDTVVVGARGYDDDTGAIYVFTKPSTGWDDVNEVTKFTASDGGEDHLFGSSVALDGNTVVAGAYGATGTVSGSGAAYILDLEASAWTDISGSGYTTTSHTVTGLTNDVQYTWAIRGANLSGNSDATTVTGKPSS